MINRSCNIVAAERVRMHYKVLLDINLTKSLPTTHTAEMQFIFVKKVLP
jgi:hypothetical protein